MPSDWAPCSLTSIRLLRFWKSYTPNGLEKRAVPLVGSGVPFECRTTWHPDLFGNDQLLALAEELAQCGVQHWVVQQRRMPHQHVPPIAGSLHTALAKKFPHFGLR